MPEDPGRTRPYRERTRWSSRSSTTSNARGAIVGNVYGLAAETFSELRRIYPVLWTCPFGR